ncbi:hypothetical protein CLOSTHATH_02483 [Hungatella hathewayi DSM 13479]|uniref:Uncharacterized protein n=1 Tax=Hungatella hathewayi DSM 13479 TaxID=566550 RepID=D3AFU7_9FIRM|nr:hypothetical protein CLOSTHATH_02483 [Hungatella hathewayi DSM 13479]
MDILLCTPPSAYRPPNTGQRKRPEVFSPPAMFLPPYCSRNEKSPVNAGPYVEKYSI